MQLSRAALSLASLLVLPLHPAHAGDRVYRCTAGDGKVTFQGQPCAGTPAPAAAPRPQAAPPRRPLTGPSEPFATPPAMLRAGPPPPAAAPVLPAMQQWASGADVMVVSGYEASAAVTQVVVDHPARPVLLVLTSYQARRWQVSAAPGTRIKAIVVGVNQGGEQVPVDAPPQVPVANDRLPYAYDKGNINFRELLKGLHARYGVEKITGYRGAYTLPQQVALKGPFAPDPMLTLAGVPAEAPKRRFAFDLVSLDGRRLPFTNTGPKDGKRYTGIVRGGTLGGLGGGPAVVHPNSRETYYLEGNGGTLVWAREGLGGPLQKLAPPPHLPPLSWGSGLAWDTRSGILAIVSFGGEGHFYRYDTKRQQWLDARSLQNRDLSSLALDAQTGEFLAISNAAELVRFNARGELEEVRPLKNLLPDLDSTYDKGNARLEGLAVAANGPDTAIVNVAKGSATHIWSVERDGRKARLTYKAE